MFIFQSKMKNPMSAVILSQDEINSGLEATAEKITEHEDMAK